MASSGQVGRHSPQEVQSGMPVVLPSINGSMVGQGVLRVHWPQLLHLSISTRMRAGAICSNSQVIAPMGQME